MANSINGRVWVLDTIGVITAKPVSIRKIIFYPNAAADAALLNYWDVENPITLGTGNIIGLAGTVTGTITSTTTLTMSSGTYLPSAIADGSVLYLTGGTGTSANLNRPVLVTTAGNNTVVVSTDAAWTNEATKSYSWVTYPAKTAIPLLSQATTARMEQIDFPGDTGFHLPNLTLESLSASSKVYIYLD